ncbi:Hypothetical predicted protein [Mytilus galloprovincialis]|uniref:Uncharacterized protein n=1 Tax=Mytilus galloprovincialis TaxID=29158 RepID=A0A8B6HJZ4_MYTGA|nr:Hypothetical predicted protein [Mytilus galloprovincialis]
MFGGLYTVPDFELIDTYQGDVENVPCILLSSDNAAYIGSYYNKKLLKMKIENHYIKLEKEVLTATFDMSWTVDGEILVSCGENGLKFYTTYVQLKSFQSFSPLKTLGVHVTGDNKIILGLTESSGLPVTKNSIRRIVVMALDGKIQHTIEYDRENKRLLSYPYRINTLNDKVVVVDLINKEHKGRVVMLDYKGQLHWTYNGCNSINSDKVKFHPRDLAITSTDMILVSDSLNHAIHVLNPDGEVIAYNDVKSVGIESPWSLSIDKKDVLWIGCNAWESDKNKKGKIHCAKLL